LACLQVVITGSSSISILINRRACRAINSDSATTNAIGCPQKWTSFSANNGSSGKIPPIWFSPGISLYVKMRSTPFSFSAS
jgi:hypothetical protein